MLPLDRHRRRAGSDNDIDLERDKLGREIGITLVATLPPTVLDGKGAALDPAKFT